MLEEDALPDFWGEVGADRGLGLSLHDCGCFQSARCGEFLTGGGSWYLLPLTMRVHFSTNARSLPGLQRRFDGSQCKVVDVACFDLVHLAAKVDMLKPNDI